MIPAPLEQYQITMTSLSSLEIFRTTVRNRSKYDYDGYRTRKQGEKPYLPGSDGKKQYHEDKPRGICSLRVLITPIGVTQLFLLRGLLGLLGRGFLFGWHGYDHRPFFLRIDRHLSETAPVYGERIVW
jgi:hypothetical protein